MRAPRIRRPESNCRSIRRSLRFSVAAGPGRVGILPPLPERGRPWPRPFGPRPPRPAMLGGSHGDEHDRRRRFDDASAAAARPAP